MEPSVKTLSVAYFPPNFGGIVVQEIFDFTTQRVALISAVDFEWESNPQLVALTVMLCTMRDWPHLIKPLEKIHFNFFM